MRTTVTEEIKLQVEEDKRASVLSEGPKTMPSSGDAETGGAGAAIPGSLDASKVAERVLSSPVVDLSEDVTSPITKPDAAISTTAEPTTISPASKPTPTTTKEVAPLGERIALPTATTETTVTGPSLSQKQGKSEGKVSSWLKNKLRRSSKPAKPGSSKASTSESAGGNGKAFVGGASLTNPASTSKSSTDPSKDGSVREVAIVGKTDGGGASSATAAPTATTAPAITPSGVASGSDDDDDDELYAASTGDQPKQRSRSSSPVSSLSSDEGEHPRGRSQLRREVTGSEENGEEEFEEARDHFETERLSPPAPLKNTVGRASDSPVRDSKFSEDL